MTTSEKRMKRPALRTSKSICPEILPKRNLHLMASASKDIGYYKLQPIPEITIFNGNKTGMKMVFICPKIGFSHFCVLKFLFEMKDRTYVMSVEAIFFK